MCLFQVEMREPGHVRYQRWDDRLAVSSKHAQMRGRSCFDHLLSMTQTGQANAHPTKEGNQIEKK